MAKKNDTSVMTLLQYDRTNTYVSSGRKVSPTLSIGRTGGFSLNKAAVDMLKAKQGSSLAFLQDENNPSDWYIRFVGANGFELRIDSKGSALFNSAMLKQKLFDSIEYTEASGAMSLAEQIEGPDGKAMWPVLTSSIACNARK